MTARLLPLLQQRSFWMPEKASSYAGDVDTLFYAILWISAGLFVLVGGVMLFFIIKYRAREGHREAESPAHSTSLELTWTIIPTLVVMVIFYYGFRGFLSMVTPPPNSYEINVNAYKWGWEFIYPNGHVDENLHVPARRPVTLVLGSQDVIHSLYIPAFRVKKDCVPGRYNKMWFQAEFEGEFRLLCAEYCGTKHSDMLATVHVTDPSNFKAWLESAANWAENLPPREAGKLLYERRGCTQCHSVDGRGGIGPSFKNLYGMTHPLKDGSSVTVDENYIRTSILNPGAQIYAGYENVMPTYQGRLKDLEITALIEYIKSLSDSAGSEEATKDTGGEEATKDKE